MSLLGFLPVALFLLSLLYLDSYKLVRLRTLVELIVIGCIAAALSLILNHWLLRLGLDRRLLTRFAAPAIEEVLKAVPIILMLRTRRIGFLIDAAICGFAVGAGFALAENLYFLSTLASAPPALWVVRGFGTAVMHGGTTAIFAIVSKSRRVSLGLTIAFILHSLFNHFILSPAMSTLVIVLILPPLLVMVFAQSESLLREWIGTGFDFDAELLQVMNSGQFAESRAGQYLQSLRDHFDGAVLEDHERGLVGAVTVCCRASVGRGPRTAPGRPAPAPARRDGRAGSGWPGRAARTIGTDQQPFSARAPR